MNKFAWYILKTPSNSEDQVAKKILKNAELYKRTDMIQELKIFRTYEIQEKDFPPNSDELPKKVYRSSTKWRWLIMPNKWHKKIRLVENKPYKGLIFLRIKQDGKEIKFLREIQQWGTMLQFLSEAGMPSVISDTTYTKMVESIGGNEKILDIDEYIKEKKWTEYVIQNKRVDEISLLDDEMLTNNNELDEFDLISGDEFDKKFNQEQENKVDYNDNNYIEKNEIFDAKKTENLNTFKTSSNVNNVKINISENKQLPSIEDEKVEQSLKIDSETLKDNIENFAFNVGDSVIIKDLGSKGIVKSLNTKTNKVVVAVLIFNREQNITTEIDNVQLDI